MSNTEEEVEKLRKEIQQLRKLCAAKEKSLNELHKEKQMCISSQYGCRLSNEEIERYSRQIILPNFGVNGQIKLRETTFLIVGLGGLGCPASQYLAAAGCGCLGLVDYDEVETSNFHRQTLHTETKIGIPKVESAREALKDINKSCQIICHRVLLNSENALEILGKYNIILDCTDNVATRYLLNDACVMLKKPLISGSALQMDGQLTVYNYGEAGPCYRCLFPVPPPPETVTNCGDGGVLGAVTGIIGSLQALEAIKVALDSSENEVLSGRLLIFEGSRCLFRNIRLRAKRPNCDVCSDSPLVNRLIDYEQFCRMKATDKDTTLNLLLPEQRLSVMDYRDKWEKSSHLLIDVRKTSEYEICNLPNSKNIPINTIVDNSYLMRNYEILNNSEIPLILLCRRGNDSQIAVQHLMQAFPNRKIYDIKGGLYSWHNQIDNSFPIY